MKTLFSARIKEIIRRSDDVIELSIEAPLAAKHFQPGHFYRLQNYETFAPKINQTSLQIEPLALIASEADRAKGLLKFDIFETGASSKLCSTFKPGDPVSLMGPTGIRAKIALEHETVLIMGDRMSIPFLKSYGSALKAQDNRVIFLCHFKDKKEIYCQRDIERAADVVIWSTSSHDALTFRPQDYYMLRGKPLDHLLHYAKEKRTSIALSDVDRVYVMGNSEMLREFQEARSRELKEILIKNPRVFGSVFSTMQCMLKGVCAQCLQWQIDPETGKRTKAVFACSWPEQPLEIIDFDNLDERLIQNQLQERISSLWVDYLFESQ